MQFFHLQSDHHFKRFMRPPVRGLYPETGRSHRHPVETSKTWISLQPSSNFCWYFNTSCSCCGEIVVLFWAWPEIHWPVVILFCPASESSNIQCAENINQFHVVTHRSVQQLCPKIFYPWCDLIILQGRTCHLSCRLELPTRRNGSMFWDILAHHCRFCFDNQKPPRLFCSGTPTTTIPPSGFSLGAIFSSSASNRPPLRLLRAGTCRCHFSSFCPCMRNPVWRYLSSFAPGHVLPLSHGAQNMCPCSKLSLPPEIHPHHCLSSTLEVAHARRIWLHKMLLQKYFLLLLWKTSIPFHFLVHQK